MKDYPFLTYYEKGQLSSGFVGYRVYRSSTKENIYFSEKQYSKKAIKLAVTEICEKISEENQVFKNHKGISSRRRISKPKNLPVGIRINLALKKRIYGENVVCNFTVGFLSQPVGYFGTNTSHSNIKKLGYIGAWRDAIDKYSKTRKLTKSQIAFYKTNPPDKDLFIKEYDRAILRLPKNATLRMSKEELIEILNK